MTKGANPSASESAQQLFGFYPESSTNKNSRFIVSENSFIQQHVDKSEDDDNFEITPRFINTILREELPKRVHRLLDSLHTTVLASPWVLPRQFTTSPLSLSSYVGLPNDIKTSVHLSGPKLRVICHTLCILDKSSYALKGFSDYTTIGQSWLMKMFGLIFSTVGDVQSFYLMNGVDHPHLIVKGLSGWLRRDQNQLHKSTSSDISITYALVHMLVRSVIHYQYLHSNGLELAPIASTQATPFNQDIVRPLQEYLFGQSHDRFTTATNLIG